MLDKSKLLVLVGPTAVGKTEIAIQLATKLGGEIVSADSRLFYRGMDIGTAKPTMEQREIVPHHLVDVVDPNESWSLAVFQERARKAIDEIARRGKLPFLVGGTGQYIRAVSQDWQPPAVKPDLRMRTVLEKWAQEIGPLELHHRLEVLDPQAARGIDYRNLRRTIRALEVILSSGYRFSEQRQSGPSKYDLLIVGLMRPREELYLRIDARIDQMIAEGLVEEVSGLLAKGYQPELPSMSAIGYREITAYLSGTISLEEAVMEMKKKTRVFVRRQANWFRMDDDSIHWFTMHPAVVEEIEHLIKQWLGNPVT